jgi:cell division protein FtsB
MHRLPLFLLLAVLGLQWPLWSGYWSIRQTKAEIAKQEKINQELVYRNAALEADIRDLKEGNDAVQERARLQLGMVKNDEVFVQVMDQPSQLKPEGTVAATPASMPTAAPATTPTSASTKTAAP